ncbi:hypothetical protein HanRHA438_Chr09g0398251 [Helianthus annuus]|nr:hypothetical protein HanRHA438_Chr09g0398251 [Helianthus annuus]
MVGIGEPMEIRVPSRRSISRSLRLFASAVQRRYQSGHASSDISGCDRTLLGMANIRAAQTGQRQSCKRTKNLKEQNRLDKKHKDTNQDKPQF